MRTGKVVTSNSQRIRSALSRSSQELLDGAVVGPLTQGRLIEHAQSFLEPGIVIKRHRLTHENSDINEEFQHRKLELNRTKPEVERLRAQVERAHDRNTKLVRLTDGLQKRLDAYAAALLTVTEERDRLRDALETQTQVPRIGRFE